MYRRYGYKKLCVLQKKKIMIADGMSVHCLFVVNKMSCAVHFSCDSHETKFAV